MTFFDVIQTLFLIGIVLTACLLIGLYIVQKATVIPLAVIKRHKKETKFLDPITIEYIDFPSFEEQPTLDLSVIIPAYNEEQRIPSMLDECLEFLEKKSQNEAFTYEVIIVSDGSTDNTVSVALKYSKRYTCKKVRVLELIENRGKGGAVRLGMLVGRGRNLLFADADGATKFSDYNKLADAMNQIAKDYTSEAVVVGSRAHLEKKAIATRSLFRTILMYGFHFLVSMFAVRSIKDTQCGFKLFTRTTVDRLFTNLHIEGWAFDAELLYLAERFKIPLKEVAVNWQEIDGSKLTPFWSWLQMGTDLFLMWFRYAIGAWQIHEKSK